MKRSKTSRAGVLAMAVTSVMSAHKTQATEYSWLPTSGTTGWTTPTNWAVISGSGTTYPGVDGDIADLDSALTAAENISLNTSLTLTVLNLGPSNGTGDYSVNDSGGTTFVINFNSPTANSGGSATINLGSTGIGQNIVSQYVTLDCPLTINEASQGVSFRGTYFNIGTNTLIINGAGTSTNVEIGETTTQGQITGSGAIIKNSLDSMDVNNLSNTFSGTVAVNGGSLVLQNGSGFPSASNLSLSGYMLASTSSANTTHGGELQEGTGSPLSVANPGQRLPMAAMTFNGGYFLDEGGSLSTAGVGSDTVTAVAFNSGDTYLSIDPNTNCSTDLYMSTVTRSPGATLVVRGASSAGLNTTSDDVFVGNSASFLAGGGGAITSDTASIIPWITAVNNNASAADVSTFATYGATGLQTYPTASADTTFTPGTTNRNVYTTNCALTGNQTVNSLVLNTGSAGGTLATGSSIGTGNTLTVASGGLIFVPTSGGYTLGAAGTFSAAGTLDFGSAEGVVWALGISTDVIGNEITGSGGLTKTGVGTLELAGANPLTGQTSIACGTLLLDNSLAVENSTVQPGSGGIEGGSYLVFSSTNLGTTDAYIFGGLTGSGSLSLLDNAANPVALSVGGETIGITSSYTGALTGSGSLTKIGSGALTLAGSSSFSGGTTVAQGTLSGSNASALGVGNVIINPTEATGTLTDNATLNVSADRAITATAAVTVNSETGDGGFGIGQINFSDSAPTIASLSGNGNVALIGAAGTALTTGTVGNPTFSGTISDDGTLTNSGSLTVTGSGTFTLAGTSTYFGSTNVNGGTLDVTGALANSSSITVNNSSNLILDGAAALPSSAIVNVGSLASAYVNNSQTLASIASTGNATFTAGTSIVGQGSGVGTGTGTTGLTTGGITGTGNLTVNGSANLYASTITQNQLTIGSSSTVTIADSSAPGNTAATSVLTDLNNSGTLDLKNNDMIINDPAQNATIVAEIANAYDGGAWDKSGITSSNAAANLSYGLGYATAAQLGTTSFDGQPVASGATLVKYTLLGDTTLKGSVSLGDYNTVVNNFGNSGATWVTGDFQHTGVVSLADYNDVVNNFGLTASVVSSNLAAPRSVSPSLHLASVVAGAVSPAVVSASDVHLEVNVTTGDVELEDFTAGNTSVLSGYEITSASGSLVPFPTQQFNIGTPKNPNYITVVEGNSLSYNESNYTTISNKSTNIAEGQTVSAPQDSNPLAPGDTSGNQVAPGTYDLGDIFAGLSGVEDLSFQWSGAGGTTTYTDAPVDYLGGTPTPEPGTLGVLGLGGVMMMRRRRRQGRKVDVASA